MPKTISEMLKEVAAEMCDSYCKYPDYCKEHGIDSEAIYDLYCKNCPLDKL